MRSTDLGMPYNQVWNVAKKGGTLLTITSDPGSMVGGGRSKSDFVQIASANELVKPDAFAQWEEQRAGARLAQQQRQQQLFSQQHQQMQPQMLPPNTPQINIKMVGGNDFSKGGEDVVNKGGERGGEKEVTFSGGGHDGGAFNNLVIPGLKKSDESSAGKTEKTIMGGLADFGSLVINKIL